MLMFNTLKKHTKSYILLAVVVLSTLIGLVGPASQEAHAETQDQIASNVKIYLNYHAFLSCATTPSYQLSSDNIKRWDIFGGDQVHVGHIISSSDGQVSCQDSNWVSGVASNFGYSDPFDLLCAAKWTTTDGGACPGDGHLQAGSANGGNIGGSAMEANMKGALLKNHSEPLLNDAERYYLYSQTFIIGCQATSVVKLSDASSSQKLEANNSLGYTLDQIENYTPTPYIYHGQLDHDRQISTDATGGSPSEYENPTCLDLTNKANSYAQAYADAIRPGYGEPGTCLDKYAHATVAEQTACDNGYKHKDDPNYCSVTYKDASNRNDPNNPEYNACKYGATIATGDMSSSSPPQSTTDNTKDVTTCSIPGLGWIICPIVTFMAHITDSAYGLVSDLLKVQPLTTTDTGGSMYNVWSVARNIANVAFVIAFLIIIFSQVTSIGVTNYGIKKMLPRLILGAILVNLSYWICSICVDLSNILGASIDQVLQNAMGNVKIFNVNAVGATGDGFVGLAGKLLVVGALGIAALYVGLSALIPTLITVLVTIVTVFIVLTIRQALIILLVVISPLAFVAYLLPNTESLFKRWRELFETLLLVYPTVGLIFGASALASKIIMASSDNTAVQVIGAGASVIPLVLVPTIINTTKGVLGKVGAYVNNPNRGPVDAMRKRAGKYREYRQNTRSANALAGRPTFGGGQFKRSYRRELRDQAASSAVKSSQAQFGVTDRKANQYVQQNAQNQAQANAVNSALNNQLVNSIANNPGLISQGMGRAASDPEVQKALAAQQEKAIADAIRDVQLTANIAPGDTADMGRRLSDAIRDGDSITARAMQNMLLTSGSAGTKEYRDAMNRTSAADMASDTMTDLKRNMLTNHAAIKNTAADLTKHATTAAGTSMAAVSGNATTWTMSDEDLVQQKTHSLAEAERAGGITKAQARKVQGDAQLYRKLDPAGKAIIDRIAL